MASDQHPSFLPDEARHGWTLLLLWAPWSSLGRRLHLALQNAIVQETVQVLQLQVEEVPELVRDLRISSVPFLVLLHDGVEVARHAGDDELKHLVTWLQSHLQPSLPPASS